MIEKIRNWFEIRLGLEGLVRSQLRDYRVPRNINVFYTLGFVAMAAFVIQMITGFFLLVYYIPHADHAFASVQHIMNKVPYGWLFRMIHSVGSNLMVATLFLHLLSVFYMGSYKKPRELTWVVGVAMLFITLTSCLSGYLLPWSQLSYWATTIVTNIPTAFPLVGDSMAKVLRGGEQVAGATLNRFFAVHVALLPPVMLAMLGIHLFLVRRIGISSPPFGKDREEEQPWTKYRHDSHPTGHPFYPDFVSKEIAAVMFFLALLFAVIAFAPTLFLHEDANTPADPFKTPERIKPEWYFLAPYQMLRLIPNKLLGISIQLVLTAGLLLWPFLDTKEERDIRKRPVLFGASLAALLTYVILTIWGMFS